MCMPFRLMERICPLGRMLAVPPPRSDTCLPGAGRFPFLATFPLPPLARLPPGRPAAGPVLPTVCVAFVCAVPVPFLPVVVPGLVVPGLVPVVDGCVPVAGLLADG